MLLKAKTLKNLKHQINRQIDGLGFKKRLRPFTTIWTVGRGKHFARIHMVKASDYSGASI
jgi:2'-5' RNA ligase